MDHSDRPALRQHLKRELRKRRLSVRRAIPRAKRRERSEAICRQLVELEEWKAAKTILAFVSMPIEVQTQPAVEHAWSAGQQVAATRMLPGVADLEIRAWNKNENLEESPLGFWQPLESAPLIPDDEIDLVIVPALAIAANGHRLGYGKGFYDRLLPRLKNACRVGVIFDFEELAELPHLAHDQPVHWVITNASARAIGV